MDATFKSSNWKFYESSAALTVLDYDGGLLQIRRGGGLEEIKAALGGFQFQVNRKFNFHIFGGFSIRISWRSLPTHTLLRWTKDLLHFFSHNPLLLRCDLLLSVLRTTESTIPPR